jgi:hypothetical protein
MEKQKIVGVKFESKYAPKTFEGREYSYFTDLELKINDIVEVPTKNGVGIAMVTRLDVPEEEIEKIKEFMKEITKKLDREEYLKNGIEG